MASNLSYSRPTPSKQSSGDDLSRVSPLPCLYIVSVPEPRSTSQYSDQELDLMIKKISAKQLENVSRS